MKLASNPQTTKTADFSSSVHISQISQGVFIISIQRKSQASHLPLGEQENSRGAALWVLWKPLPRWHAVPLASLQMWGPEKGPGLLGLLEKSGDLNKKVLKLSGLPWSKLSNWLLAFLVPL